MARNVVFNPGFFKKLERSEGVDRLTRQGAERGLEKARATAPVDEGDYLNGLTIEKSDRPGRVTYRIIGKDRKTLIIEAITGNLARCTKGVGRG